MLKRGFAFALALVMLVSVASAVEAVTPDGDTYEVSAWAQKDVAALGEDEHPQEFSEEDVRSA